MTEFSVSMLELSLHVKIVLDHLGCLVSLLRVWLTALWCTSKYPCNHANIMSLSLLVQTCRIHLSLNHLISSAGFHP